MHFLGRGSVTEIIWKSSAWEVGLSIQLFTCISVDPWRLGYNPILSVNQITPVLSIGNSSNWLLYPSDTSSLLWFFWGYTSGTFCH